MELAIIDSCEAPGSEKESLVKPDRMIGRTASQGPAENRGEVLKQPQARRELNAIIRMVL
jgi:hypothetical protein